MKEIYARVWLVHFTDAEPVLRKYQWPVKLAQVLNDHRAAIAAEPVKEETEND
jgi:hypothetical protein